MRIGSLFSGAGGLDMAVAEVFSGEIVWHAEIDKSASKVLAHRFPGVPNLGDITAVDWCDVPAVDVLCGGFPCQDVSAAGKRAGIKAGTRSGLWAVFADAIDALRPQWVVIENVRGLLSAAAHRTVEDAGDSLEPDTGTMGDGAGRPVLRAAGAVLGDLADLGYDAQWATVAAADVGAPHRRERVFIVASVADATQNGLSGQGLSGRVDAAQPKSGRSDASFPHSSSYGRHEGRAESARLVGGFDAAVSGDEPGVALLPTPTQSDGTGGGIRTGLSWEGTTKSTGDGGMDLRTTVSLLPTPTCEPQTGNGHARNLGHEVKPAQWGKYAPAIARWEALTRPAPAPTEPNKNGNPRLSALFSEWLMGWPAGWVTDPAIGISRNDQLRIVGNGVCPQQAVAALRFLLAVST